MPSTPKVNFNFINNNVEESSPLEGVSIVLARTTKGPILDPSSLIKDISQFKRTFGEEIVPDGSVSNIEKALEGRSILRVIRVVGPGAAQGVVNDGEPVMVIQAGEVSKAFVLQTRGNGDPIGIGSNYKVEFRQQLNTLYYQVIDEGGNQIEASSLFTYKNYDPETGNKTSVDYLALYNWMITNPYFQILLKDIEDDGEGGTVYTPGGSLESFITELAKADESTLEVSVYIGMDSFFADRNGVIIEGNDGEILAGQSDVPTTWVSFDGTIGTMETSAPTYNEYIEALEYIKDYTDAYNVIISDLEMNIGQADALKVYKPLKTMADELNEYRVFIEVPWFKLEGGTVAEGGTMVKRSKAEIIAAVDTIINTIGNSKWVSYFTSGLIYNNKYGIPQSSSVLGTVLGLADASASTYGYNYSFAGVNRGVVGDAQGPVLPNYGSPARVADLEDLAQHYLNVFVIKDTPSFGKRTLLWHNFTSQVKSDSFRFLGVTGLVLNIKKTLRPILESYIEEPNYWGTWKDMYLKIKPLIDQWVADEAMTDPRWFGDQDASSWADLSINTEAEARAGHYKAVFIFKDIVALQDITLDVVIDSASKSVSVDLSE